MTLIFELPQELEAELLAYWHRAGLIQTESDFSKRQQHTEDANNDLSRFQLPNALHNRLQALLDHQDSGEELAATERLEAESLVELAEFLSLLHLRSLHIASATQMRQIPVALRRLVVERAANPRTAPDV